MTKQDVAPAKDTPTRDTNKDTPVKDTPARTTRDTRDTPARDTDKGVPAKDATKDAPAKDTSKTRATRTDQAEDTTGRPVAGKGVEDGTGIVVGLSKELVQNLEELSGRLRTPGVVPEQPHRIKVQEHVDVLLEKARRVRDSL